MEFMIQEICRIFQENNTEYKIIVSPLYEQVKFSNHDLSILRKNFGPNLFDFSGNNDFTKSKFNFYEKSHYRKEIADKILEIVYK